MSSVISRLVSEMVSAPGFDANTFDVHGWVSALSAKDVDFLHADAEARDADNMTCRFDEFFPDEGPYRRELYSKHLLFFKLGKYRTERLFLAANRVGKSVAGAYECAAHATNRYPKWWEGKRFSHPTWGWAAGDTNETVRDIIQKELFGEIKWEGNRKGFDGSGMIPKQLIGPVTWKRGVADLADVVKVKHLRLNGEWGGGWSRIGLKSYDQGRRVFQGTAKHWIWLDEEVPEDVYGECLIRLMTTRGVMILTFTPLLGMTELVMSFLDAQRMPELDDD